MIQHQGYLWQGCHTYVIICTKFGHLYFFISNMYYPYISQKRKAAVHIVDVSLLMSTLTKTFIDPSYICYRDFVNTRIPWFTQGIRVFPENSSKYMYSLKSRTREFMYLLNWKSIMFSKLTLTWSLLLTNLEYDISTSTIDSSIYEAFCIKRYFYFKLWFRKVEFKSLV